MYTKTKLVTLSTAMLFATIVSAPSQAADVLPPKTQADPADTGVMEEIKIEAPKASISFAKPEITSEAAPKPVEVKKEVAPEPVVTPKPQPTVTKAAAPVPAPAPKVEPAPVVAAPSGKGATVASAALGQIGVMQDCTMLVTNSLRSVGINFHDWPAGYFSLGTQIPASQAQPGDLIYYMNGSGPGSLAHIAVYIGNGQAVHGGWNGNETRIWSVNVGSGPVFIRLR